MEERDELEYQVYREFEVLEMVGKGTYGVVYRARHKKTRKVLAIKKIIDAFQNLIDAKRTYRELNYLLQLQHPAVVRLQYLLAMGRKGGPQQPSTTRLAPPHEEIRGCNTDKLGQALGSQPRHVYAVFEYAETDLRNVLKRCPQLQPIQRKFISYQLLQGIAYLHRSGLVHRDIKPQNLLINCNKLELKICDFGMARLQASVQGNEGVLTEYVASRGYRPPEALLGITTCQPAIDLWSVGCVLAELALGVPLFSGKSTLDQLELIFRAIGLPSSSEIEQLQSEEAKYVIRNFSFSRKARNKPLKDTLTSCQDTQLDLISKLLAFVPTQRISAEQALRHQYFEEVRGINEHLQSFSYAKVNVRDFSDNTSKEKGSKNKIGIEQYRVLIEQLEKYVQKSTNRSILIKKNRNNLPEPSYQEVEHIKMQDKQSELKDKSTKESNFVSQNKHHFLKRTQQAFEKRNKSKHQNQHGKDSKTPKDRSPSKKYIIMKKQKCVVSQPSEVLKEKSGHKKGKINNRPRIESRQRQTIKQNKIEKADAYQKQRLSRHKMHIRGGSHDDSRPKRPDKVSSQSTILAKYKSASKLTGNVSMVSQHSKASSHHSQSRQRSKEKGKKGLSGYLGEREAVVRKLAKPSLRLIKSGLVKCKSAQHVNKLNLFNK